MPGSKSTSESKVPDLGSLVDDLLEVTAESLRRSSDQAQKVWDQITSGDYEPKDMLRDTARFWAGATKDVAKTFVKVRDFLVEVAQDEDDESAK